jgi:hypothetical protein
MFIVIDIPIALVKPENKDYERALGLASDYDDAVPSTPKAMKMSKLIKDPLKLVRRSKAVVGIWGTDDHEGKDVDENVWLPFKKALKDMGFTEDQIDAIENFEIDEENL